MAEPPQSQPRRFPAPWSVEAIPGGFKVLDATGFVLAYVYARDDLQWSSLGAPYMTTDEARRIASGIAWLPELLSTARRTPD